ncbi:ribonuclease H-like domain-containing protein [Tanacetum coccineum]
MYDEYKALIDNNTWVLVPRQPNINIVRFTWLYKHKYNADGSLNWYKVRLVANDRSQQQGIDYDEIFNLVVKPATIRTVLSLAVSRKWPIHQLDVKNAFLHDHLTETVYMHQPSGFTNSTHSDYTLAHLTIFSVSATRTTSGIFLSQTKYATEILEQAQMLNCNPSRTPIDTEKSLDLKDHRRQDTLSRSNAEAEYRGVVNVVAKTSWIRNLLREFHTPLFTETLVYCDNVSVVYMSANPVQHQRTKHIEIDIHFVHDKVAAGHVRVLHVPSRFQYAVSSQKVFHTRCLLISDPV